MFDSVKIIGRGRVGSAISARLSERGVILRDDEADLVLLCVPDSAIRDVASNYLVTLYRAAARLFATAGAPPEALIPLMQQNDRQRVRADGPDCPRRPGNGRRAHRRYPRAGPELEVMYRALAEVTTP